MNEVFQFALLGASLIYFWTVMFDRFSRSCSLIGGVILIGAAGSALKPGENAFFDTMTVMGFTGLLLARSWLIWKDWCEMPDLSDSENDQ